MLTVRVVTVVEGVLVRSLVTAVERVLTGQVFLIAVTAVKEE